MSQHDNRNDGVFRCIVESYIETATPVGSRIVSKKYPGHLSPATIRNVMADLEEAGLIHQPHTSAGRVPTDRGYRHYVDAFVTPEHADFEVPDVRPLLQELANIEDAAERMSRLLADLTRNAGVMYLKKVHRISYLADLPREAESPAEEGPVNDRLYVEGTSHIFEQPEFQSPNRIRSLLRAFEEKERLAALLEGDLAREDVQVHIGGEVGSEGLEGVSMITKEYSVNGLPAGCLGVIGPTRMRYDQAIGVVTKLADAMTAFLNELL
jgi:heat-inducible transcriptional repressor